MGIPLFFDNYTPVGDLTVIATCLVIFWLLFTSYVNKTTSFWVFVNIVIYLMLAGASDVLYHFMYTTVTDGNYTAVFVVRVVYHALLFSNLLLYVVYIVAVQRLELRRRIPVMVLSSLLYVTVIAVDIYTTVRDIYFNEVDNRVVTASNIFFYGYIGFVAICLSLMVIYRRRLFKQVMYGFYGTIVISFLILFLQGWMEQTSFTVVSFLFPTLTMLYTMHSNPYDASIGAIDASALEDYVRNNYRRRKDLIFMSLYLPDFEKVNSGLPMELQNQVRYFTEVYFRNAILFQVNSGHMILMARAKHNPDYKERFYEMLDSFYMAHARFDYDYKIVAGRNVDEISAKNDYIHFIDNIHRNMDMNTVHLVNEEDAKDYRRTEYIISQLADIYKKKDLQDPRVLAYCQPVYNIRSGKYDTAEALMRLQLPELGMVFPDQFIPLAEENGYVHVLTTIILSRTCQEIRNLTQQGYQVRRISVNVSAVELQDENFTEDISQIIRDSHIPENKVAIEVTESQTEDDFVMVKQKIEELKEHGIIFYLDDFGTGYSNMERILELPFDIIKFDRSLVIASNMDERAGKMIASLANMFRNLDYSVLYEGVEDENDESRCINMSASYLQGYKYSKPIPIKDLHRFFERADRQI